jgi:hypothetical protein
MVIPAGITSSWTLIKMQNKNTPNGNSSRISNSKEMFTAETNF